MIFYIYIGARNKQLRGYNMRFVWGKKVTYKGFECFMMSDFTNEPGMCYVQIIHNNLLKLVYLKDLK